MRQMTYTTHNYWWENELQQLCSDSEERELGKTLSDQPQIIWLLQGSEALRICVPYMELDGALSSICLISKMVKEENLRTNHTSFDETFPADRELRKINKLRNWNFNHLAKYDTVFFCKIIGQLFCMSVTKIKYLSKCPSQADMVMNPVHRHVVRSAIWNIQKCFSKWQKKGKKGLVILN